MPMPFAHGLVGASLVAAIHPHPLARRTALPLFAGFILANLADLDFLLVFALHSKAWHRGFSHSIGFAFLVSIMFAFYFGRRRWRESLAYSLAFASHGIVDFLTTKVGGGVELLWPFSTTKWLLGWRGLSEMPSKMTELEIIQALVVEILLFTPLLFTILGLRRMIAKRTPSTEEAI